MLGVIGMTKRLKKLINHILEKNRNRSNNNKDKGFASSSNGENSKSNIPPSTVQPDELPIIILAEGICERLLGTKFEDLLLTDFNSQYSFTYADFGSRENICNKLNLIMNDIFRYLNLPPLVKLEVIHDYNDNDKNMGFFTTSSTKKTITIKIGRYYGPSNIIAVLCHECTHYFMEYYGFNCCDEEINERRTDVFSNLIGFSKLMEEGYEEIEITEGSGSYSKRKLYKIGYISADNCRAIRRHLLSQRIRINENRKKQLRTSEIKNELRKNYETAEILYKQLQSMDFNNQGISFDPKIVEKIQYALYEYEGRNIDSEIKEIKNVLDNEQRLSYIREKKLSAEKLCADLIRWAAIFQGNC